MVLIGIVSVFCLQLPETSDSNTSSDLRCVDASDPCCNGNLMIKNCRGVKDNINLGGKSNSQKIELGTVVTPVNQTGLSNINGLQTTPLQAPMFQGNSGNSLGVLGDLATNYCAGVQCNPQSKLELPLPDPGILVSNLEQAITKFLIARDHLHITLAQVHKLLKRSAIMGDELAGQR